MGFWLRTSFLALMLSFLQAVDFWGFASSTAVATPGWLLLSSLITAGALGWAAVASRWRAWRLVGALFLAHYGVATLMTAIEVVYLPVLHEVVPSLLVNGAITSALFAPAVVALHGRWNERSAKGASLVTAGQLAWRLAFLALIWMVLFTMAGLLVFVPAARLLAPELLERGYTNVPAWVLPFQGARGLLWLGLSLPLLASLDEHGVGRGVILGTLFAALLGANLLMPNPLLPAGLRTAHFAEVVLGNFIFGFLAGVLLTPSTSRRTVDASR